MSIDETKSIIQKIKAFRPFFHTGNSPKEQSEFMLTWHEVLEPYEYEDVNQKVNEYFRDGDNIGKIPDAYYLVKYLRTHIQKREIGDETVQCHVCKNWIPLSNYELHFERCSSVNNIKLKMKKYFNKEIDVHKLMDMPRKEFEIRYLNFIQKIIPKLEDSKEKNSFLILEKALKNEKIDFNLNEVI